ncbi:MAG: MFS transporter [Rhizobiaceae bacterium]|jgi:MFS family permease|nr:MFS transporter [Rhizobiaceae bacterium]
MSSLLPVFALLRGTLFLLIASGLHSILLPVRGAQEGFPTVLLGLLGTSWAAGFVAACLLAPRLVQKVGHVRAFSSFAAVMAIVALLTGLIVEIWAWIGLRFVTGFAIAGAFMVVESWLHEKSTNDNRGQVFAVYQMVCYGGLTIGQMLLPLGDVSGESLFMVTGIFLCLALIPTAMSTASAPQPLRETRLDLKALYTNSPVAAVGIFLIGGANGAWGTLGPVYGAGIGLSNLDIALMMSASMIFGALTQWPAGRISDRMDRRFVLGGAAGLCAAVSLAAFAFNPVEPRAVLVATALYGGLAYTLYSIAAAHANDHARDGNFVEIASGMLLLYGIGTMAGPLVASAMMQAGGPQAIFLATALFQGLVVALVVWRIRRRAAPSAKEAFRPMPMERAMTPEAARLDPRGN